MLASAEFCLLGPLVVRCDGIAVPIPQRRQRALLAVLLLQSDRACPAARLAELLWGPGEPPPSAEATVRNYVKRLRRALGTVGLDRIITVPGGYLIRVESGELDVTVLEQALVAAHVAARRDDWQQADLQAGAALSLWRGAPLADVDLPELAAEARRLAELRLQAHELRAEAGLHLGRHVEILAGLRQLTMASPLRERLQGLLMLALYRSGCRAEALAAYQAARDLLVNEVGSEPGPELQALHRQILSDDPALAPPLAGHRTGTLGPAGAPRQLPAAVVGFTGRDGELAALTGLLGGHPGAAAPPMVISAIGGTAGVGKTALAIQWAHRVAGEFPDGQLYVNLRGFDSGQPTPPTEALAGFLAALGVPGPQIPLDPDGRAAAFRSVLAGRRVLIILDNARDAGQVRPLLPGEPGCMVVVTSRDLLAGLVARDGARRVLLDVLPPADAVALLRELIGTRADEEPQATARLADLCCCLPLALRVAAELAVGRPSLSLAVLVGELEGQDLLNALEAGGDQATAVRAVFSWSCGYLTVGAAQAFRLASLHPGADFDADAVAALTGTTFQEAAGALAELARASLIQQVSSGRYGMHDLLRSYAAELAAAQDPGTGQREAMTRLLDRYLNAVRRAAHILFPADAPLPADAPDGPSGPVFSDGQAARAWLDAERANLTAAALYASEHDWPGHAPGLSTALFGYLQAGGFLAEALIIHGAAVVSAIQAGDRAAEAAAVSRMGTVYGQLGRHREAEQHFQRALREGRHQQAAQQLRLARSTFHDAGVPAGEAHALCFLGELDLRLARPARAAARYRQALTIFRQISEPSGEAEARNGLGEAPLAQGAPGEARTHHQAALAIARSPESQARAHEGLGDLAAAEGDIAAARPSWQAALDLYVQMEMPDAERVRAKLTG